ncbi:peptide ABC transporter substrate-binding protein [Pseudomonas sp. HMSC066A08]|nr:MULTISPECIES: ABC transporter substrate-binding protein [Pseudomonas]MBL4547721.1 ABC transporter substrate-binding protein [Pseudomonas aeruginosa]MDG3603784.1 ABC transporter substrate-binding protein [Pseudomonas aeruginosa]MDG3788397.1 ABC transporter substrate-binding protein [Pseudomonas aeruginosa]MDG4116860.1 ABC transporter substrate-binding protein [Pseudomonas aeruginosa]MDG4134658.1 ABC transporter substrate-binding protein [Pseudomonas aeruginosa]
MTSPTFRLAPRRSRHARLLAGLLAAGLAMAGAASAEPTRGGQLDLVAQPEPPSLSHAVVSHVATQYVGGKILEGLITFDTELKPQPVLARNWSVAADGLTYTFELQPDVKWHDGQPFGADDVVFSFSDFYPQVDKRMASIFAEYVDSVQARGDSQVVFRLKKPFSPLLSALGSGLRPIVPRHLYAGTDYRSNPYNLKPVGTGPFVFQEWKRGAYIRLARNPDYWHKGLPYLDGIVYHVIPDAAARAAAFERGEVQVLRSGDADYADLARLSRLPGVAQSEKGYELYPGQAFLQINTRKPGLDNPKVRQAILYSLNRQFIVDNIFFGTGRVASGPFLGAFHDPQLPQYGFDPAKAKALLAESGADVGKLRVRLLNGEKGGAWERLAEYTRQALRPLGIKVQVATSDAATWYQRASDWDFDLTYNFIFQIGDPYLATAYLYRSDYILKTSPFANITGYSDPGADALWQRIADTGEGPRRRALYAELERKLNDDLPIAPIFEMRFPTLYHQRVHNLIRSATSLNDSYAEVYLEPAAQ